MQLRIEIRNLADHEFSFGLLRVKYFVPSQESGSVGSRYRRLELRGVGPEV